MQLDLFTSSSVFLGHRVYCKEDFGEVIASRRERESWRETRDEDGMGWEGVIEVTVRTRNLLTQFERRKVRHEREREREKKVRH